MREDSLNAGDPTDDAVRPPGTRRRCGASPVAGPGHAAETLHGAEALAATLPPLLVAAERVAATVSQGIHGRRRVGPGESFWQFRRYHPGDAIQRIDWRKSAKSQHVYIRQTEWEAAQSVWLWRDGSPSMSYRSARGLPTKKERAEILLLALASLLARGGEHLALLGRGETPAPGRAALRRIAESLYGDHSETASMPARESLPRYSRMVIVGDLLSPLPDIQRALAAYAAQGVRGHLLQILDPAEETLPFSGRVRFQGMEGDGDMLIGRVEDVRAGYRGMMATHKQAVADIARAIGWSHAVHHTSQPPQPALLALYLVLSETVK